MTAHPTPWHKRPSPTVTQAWHIYDSINIIVCTVYDEQTADIICQRVNAGAEDLIADEHGGEA